MNANRKPLNIDPGLLQLFLTTRCLEQIPDNSAIVFPGPISQKPPVHNEPHVSPEFILNSASVPEDVSRAQSTYSTPAPEVVTTDPNPTDKHNVAPAFRPPYVVCFLFWQAFNRPGEGRFIVKDIDPDLCTHIVYAYGLIDNDDKVIVDYDESRRYAATIALRDSNPNLKILLALGANAAGTTRPFPRISRNASRLDSFVSRITEFLRLYEFDGLDAGWHNPSDTQERDWYSTLLKKFRESFENESTVTGQRRLLLSANVHGSFNHEPSAYNVPEVSKYADFINVMMFLSHDSWETLTVGHNNALYAPKFANSKNKKLSIDHSAREWVNLGAPKEKLMIGMSTYGNTYTLKDPTRYNIGSRVTGYGSSGIYTQIGGSISYFEICEFIDKGNVTYVWNDEVKAPFVARGDQWIGFNDVKSLKIMMEWLKKEGYGGIAVFSLDLDDFTGTFCKAGRYPLLRAMIEGLAGYTVKLEYRDPYESSDDITKDHISPTK